MMRYFLLSLFIVHGLIHLLGFFKAFEIGTIEQLSKNISRSTGMFWLTTATLFLVAAALFFLKNNAWQLVAFLAIILSQSLIVLSWTDAKWGTIPNLLLLFFLIVSYASTNFENQFRQDIQLAATSMSATDRVTREDIDHLPPPVQRYLLYAGVVGQPRIHNMKVLFEGEMREKGKAWFPFTAEQYTFFDDPTRLFFMKAAIKGIPAWGYHAYCDTNATMTVKVMSLFPVVDIKDHTLFQAESVTYLNDLCLMAPAALIDPRISWEPIDNFSALATFSNKGTTIRATLYFNAKGQLVNFISDDRYDIAKGQQLRFSTPTGEYATFNETTLTTYGEAVWHYPDGPFTYGKFTIKDIQYNVPLQQTP
jgi:hypothetical protein